MIHEIKVWQERKGSEGIGRNYGKKGKGGKVRGKWDDIDKEEL